MGCGPSAPRPERRGSSRRSATRVPSSSATAYPAFAESDVLTKLKYALFTPFPVASDPHIEAVCRDYDVLNLLMPAADGRAACYASTRADCIEILWYLSRVTTVSALMARHPHCMGLLRQWSREGDSELQVSCSGTIVGVSWPAENRALVEAALMSTVDHLLREGVYLARKFAATTLMILANGKEQSADIIARGMHVDLVAVLRAADPDPAKWGEGWNFSDKIEPYALSCLMKLAQWPDSRAPIREAGALAILSPMVLAAHIGGLIACIALAFLVGSEESHTYTKLLSHEPAMVALVELLENLVLKRGDEKNGHYKFGYFQLDMVLAACLSIAISDFNRKRLASPLVRDLLKRSIDEFDYVQGNLTELRLASELLLTLSFITDSDEALRADGGFMDRASGVLDTVSACRARLRDPEDAPSVQSLLLRLTPKPAPAVEMAKAQKHLMISYCWDRLARPGLVELFAQQLRKLGYEVWRDVDGSALLGPMAGSTDAVMADAIELSHAVIIFVSREYKRSSNCRMEATYANQLHKLGKLHIVYVMMQSDYTTVSSPDSVDGYLGLMVGGALWYPLFDESMLAGTAAKVAQLIGDEARQVEVNAIQASRFTSASKFVAAQAARPSVAEALDTKLERLTAYVAKQDERIEHLERVLNKLMEERGEKRW